MYASGNMGYPRSAWEHSVAVSVALWSMRRLPFFPDVRRRLKPWVGPQSWERLLIKGSLVAFGRSVLELRLVSWDCHSCSNVFNAPTSRKVKMHTTSTRATPMYGASCYDNESPTDR